MATDIRLASLILIPLGVPRPLELGGDGVAASFVSDPDVVSAAGINGPVFGKMRTPKGVLTITSYARDTIHKALRDIYQQQQLPGFYMGGSMTNSDGEFVAWSTSWITQAAAVDLEESPSTKSWTIEIGKHQIGQVV